MEPRPCAFLLVWWEVWHLFVYFQLLCRINILGDAAHALTALDSPSGWIDRCPLCRPNSTKQLGLCKLDPSNPCNDNISLKGSLWGWNEAGIMCNCKISVGRGYYFSCVLSSLAQILNFFTVEIQPSSSYFTLDFLLTSFAITKKWRFPNVVSTLLIFCSCTS